MSRPWQVGDIVENLDTLMRAMIVAARLNRGSYEISFGSCPSDWWITQEAMEKRGWKLVEPKVLIPPGTPTHVFTDIPDDDLLTSREGHPYT